MKKNIVMTVVSVVLMTVGGLCFTLSSTMKGLFGKFMEVEEKTSALLFCLFWLGPLFGVAADQLLSKKPLREWVVYMTVGITISVISIIWICVPHLISREHEPTVEVQTTIGLGVSCFMNGVCLFIEALYQYKQLKKIKSNQGA